MRRLKYL